MRPDARLLPPGLILVAAFLNMNKREQTDAVRLKADPGTITEAMAVASEGAERLIKHGITAGDRLIVTLTAVLPDEQVPAVAVNTLLAHDDLGRIEVEQKVSQALMDMMLDFITAAAKPKAPPCPVPSRSAVH